ncbi:MAG: 50S ribosomal protein L5 [Nitrospinota bacterium]|nr:50S ribosomal protein L5 [Nitrospinota bacterium]MDH5678070.1 50S ribosomal protein L5 [Nitrospinota bacterium]MDH5755550.1 50S ribosomal protein L5 [Nitrospinota bacterium]
MSGLEQKYNKEIIPILMKEFGYKSVMQAPRLEKVVLNMGLGEALQNAKIIDDGVYTLTRISGQKPVITRARKAISNFKLREGAQVGVCVTIRGKRMYQFLERLITAAIPRIRDFRGVSGKGFDGHGNYTLGVKEQLIFPEVDYDKVSKVLGLNISMVTSAGTDAEARSLLAALGMPFRN